MIGTVNATQQQPEPQVIIRQMLPEDIALVFSTWLHSAREGNPVYRRMRKTIFFDRQHRVVERLMYQAQMLVACLDDDPHCILGWLCFSPSENVAHYAFTKSPFRRMGIARKLVEASGLDLSKCSASHFTDEMKWIIDKTGISLDTFSIP